MSRDNPKSAILTWRKFAISSIFRNAFIIWGCSHVYLYQEFIIVKFATGNPTVDRHVHLAYRLRGSRAHPCSYQIVAAGRKLSKIAVNLQLFYNCEEAIVLPFSISDF